MKLMTEYWEANIKSLRSTALSLKPHDHAGLIFFYVFASGRVVSKWLEHRTPDRKACFRCSMSPNTLREHTEYVLVNQWVRSLVGLFTSAGTGEYFPPLQFTCRNCGGGDRGRVAIYRPFGEFLRA
ncbi:hypothetical protein TNCV_430941 [Trichonephila clavipes]|nr:hypothetical protein TNCV_430941 [Trichonephila clavipes]